MNQGDVYWYTFRAPGKRRPIVILTPDRAIRHLNAVTAASITAHVRHAPSEVSLGPEDGMSGVCVVSLYQLHTVFKRQVEARITTLRPRRLEEVRAALMFALGIYR